MQSENLLEIVFESLVVTAVPLQAFVDHLAIHRTEFDIIGYWFLNHLSFTNVYPAQSSRADFLKFPRYHFW